MTNADGLTIDLAEPGWADAPETLVSLLSAHDQGPVTFDASAAGLPATQVVQAILSAMKTFEPKGQPVRVVGATEAFVDGLETLGLADAVLNKGD